MKLTISPTRFIRRITSAYNTEEEWFKRGKEVQLKHDQPQLEACEKEAQEKMGELIMAAQYYLDFHSMPTDEWVRRYGAGITGKQAADRLRQALKKYLED